MQALLNGPQIDEMQWVMYMKFGKMQRRKGYNILFSMKFQ